jgi:prolyl-tRNA editing enzyme YbaK/EbsC (Cys-tRNA(Pro) deacylase)
MGPPAIEFLTAKGIPFDVIHQSKATFTCKASSVERKISKKEIVKNVILKRREPASPTCSVDAPLFIHCLVQGHLDVEFPKINGIAGVEYEFASPEEVLELTGQVVGTVHPFSAISRKYMDIGVTSLTRVSCTSGDPMIGMFFTVDDLIRALELPSACIVDLAEDPDLEDKRWAQSVDLPLEAWKIAVSEQWADKMKELHTALPPTINRSEVLDLLRTMQRFALHNNANAHTIPSDYLCRLLSLNPPRMAVRYVLESYLETGVLVDDLAYLTDSSLFPSLSDIVSRVMDENPEDVARCRGPKANLAKRGLNSLMKLCLKQSRGMFDPTSIKEVLQAKLHVSQH